MPQMKLAIVLEHMGVHILPPSFSILSSLSAPQAHVGAGEGQHAGDGLIQQAGGDALGVVVDQLLGERLVEMAKGLSRRRRSEMSMCRVSAVTLFMRTRCPGRPG